MPRASELPEGYNNGPSVFGVRFNRDGTQYAFRNSTGTIEFGEVPQNGKLAIGDRVIEIHANDVTIEGDATIQDLVVPAGDRTAIGKLTVNGVFRINP